MTFQLNRHQRRALGEAGLAIEKRLIEAASLEQQLAALKPANTALLDGVDALFEPVNALAALINERYPADEELVATARFLVATMEANNIRVMEAMVAALPDRADLKDRLNEVKAAAKHHRPDDAVTAAPPPAAG